MSRSRRHGEVYRAHDENLHRDVARGLAAAHAKRIVHRSVDVTRGG
jgi:hypothetical protein